MAERVVRVNASKSYDVIISKGSINKAGEYIKKVFPSLKNAVIVSDDNVFPLYGEAVKKTLNENEIRALEFVVPHGEKSKDITVLSQLLEFLAENKVDKKSVLLARGSYRRPYGLCGIVLSQRHRVCSNSHHPPCRG
ncbi:MAG TPA: hypothetical protein PLD98_07815 [Clostridiales bacterium]|nr:hypothetical protein [Clostridiales bacterium]